MSGKHFLWSFSWSFSRSDLRSDSSLFGFCRSKHNTSIDRADWLTWMFCVGHCRSVKICSNAFFEFSKQTLGDDGYCSCYHCDSYCYCWLLLQQVTAVSVAAVADTLNGNCCFSICYWWFNRGKFVFVLAMVVCFKKIFLAKLQQHNKINQNHKSVILNISFNHEKVISKLWRSSNSHSHIRQVNLQCGWHATWNTLPND